MANLLSTPWTGTDLTPVTSPSACFTVLAVSTSHRPLDVRAWAGGLAVPWSGGEVVAASPAHQRMTSLTDLLHRTVRRGK